MSDVSEGRRTAKRLNSSAPLAFCGHRGRGRVVRDRRGRPHGAHQDVRKFGEAAHVRETDDQRVVVVHRDADRVTRTTHLPTNAVSVPDLETIRLIVSERASKREVPVWYQVVCERIDSDQLRGDGFVRLEGHQLEPDFARTDTHAPLKEQCGYRLRRGIWVVWERRPHLEPHYNLRGVRQAPAQCCKRIRGRRFLRDLHWNRPQCGIEPRGVGRRNVPRITGYAGSERGRWFIRDGRGAARSSRRRRCRSRRVAGHGNKLRRGDCLRGCEGISSGILIAPVCTIRMS